MLAVQALRQLTVGEFGDDRAGVRALDREHRVVVQAVLDLVVVSGRVLLEPREVLLVVRRVCDGQEAVGPRR